MMQKIYLAISTRPYQNAGTNSKPVLILGNNNRDILHHTFELSEKLHPGKSHLFSLDVSERNLQAYYQYMRVGLRDSDLWEGESIFVFGDFLNEGRIDFEPLAVSQYLSDRLSTDEKEGKLSIPLSRATIGNRYTDLNRIMVLVQNTDDPKLATTSPILITIEKQEGERMDFQIPEGALQQPKDTFFTIRGFNENFRATEIKRIAIHIGGPDTWQPLSVRILGLDNRRDDYEQIIPLVNISNWQNTDLGPLKEDLKGGNDSLTLYQAYL